MASEYLMVTVHAPGDDDAQDITDLLGQHGYEVYRAWRLESPDIGDTGDVDG